MATAKKKTKSKLTKTQQVLIAMLTENTGRSLCDSGGTPKYDAKGKYVGSTSGYGRSYERNQGRDFLSEPSCQFEIIDIGDGKPDVSVTVNLFHWLSEKVTYDAKLTKRFNRFASLADNKDRVWLKLIQEFPLYLREKDLHVTGLYGDENASFSPTYTYNEENALSQDIQYVYFEVESEPYVLVQIHNGADARSGLTSPKVFSINDEGASFFQYNNVSLCGTAPKVEGEQKLFNNGEVKPIDRIIWESDNGGSSFTLEEGGEAYGVRRQKILGYNPDYETTDNPDFRGKGFVYVDVAGSRIIAR